MRINVYTEELLPENSDQRIVEVVTAKYISSRTGRAMKNYGIRIFLKSHPDLHYIPGRDDDRSAITFWVGSNEEYVKAFLDLISDQALASVMQLWHDKVEQCQETTKQIEGLDE